MVLGFAFLMAPLLFSILPSRDLAGQVAGKVVARLDLAAWIGFGGAILPGPGRALLAEYREAEVVGPLRLWGAAALLALLMCFTSGFIITPKLRDIRARMDGPVETLPRTTPTAPPTGRPTAFRASSWACACCSPWAWRPGSWRCPAPEPPDPPSAPPI